MDLRAKQKKCIGTNPLNWIVICVHIASISFAQTPNNNCSTPSTITIPNSGFGLGTFTSTTYDISQDNIQTGETFAPAILVAGLNKKSMWYKFSIYTTRAIRITLAQPGAAITAGDAGFAIYKTNNCPPANSDISPKLTPIGTFGNTFHPCVDAGDYLIQVTGNDNANGPLYVQVQISDSTNSVYDHPSQAYNFGTLAPGVKSIDYSIDCQSIENASEVCPVLYNSSDYNKSTWHVFKTPAYFDYLAIMLASPSGSFSNGSYNTIGYTLYRGDARATPLSSLVPVAACDSFYTSGYYPAYRLYKCSDLDPDSTYSIQLLFRSNFNDNIRLAISLSGVAPSQAPEPILSAIPASNNLGVLPSSPSGQTTNASDYFGCNSRHIIHPCEPSLPANGFDYYANGYYRYNYNLSTFYTFTLTQTSSLDITTTNNCWPVYFRLYKQGLSNSCNSLDTNNIVSQFQYSGYNITCLDPGNYTLQICGSDTNALAATWWYFIYYQLNNSPTPFCLLGNLGTGFNLSITARSLNTDNNYSLSTTGAFDTINANAGVMQPLINGSYYNTNIDTLGCANTVLPADTACNPTNKKGIYREFLVADSGIVSLYDYSYYSIYNFPTYLYNKLYRGDANALATAQNVHAYPQRITGLTPSTECLLYNYSTPAKACVVPGTYTYVAFGDESNVDNRNRPSFQFEIVNTIHDSPAHAEDMGDILNIIPQNFGSMSSSIDHFSCKDNVVPINGYIPCQVGTLPATKAIYRQFYLNSSATITISAQHYSTLFLGRITDGVAGLTPLPYPWQCFYSASSTDNCLSPGWYTIISYGGGPTYEDPLQNYNNGNYYLGINDAITISACPGPKHNRPYKAAIDTATNQPFLLQWAPRAGSTSAYPVTDTTYTLYTEYYNCTVDTPFSTHPIASCDASMTKVTYYVFKTVQESYVQISTGDHWSAVYSGDARYDSASFGSAAPIQPCVYNNGNIQICRLQPGTYTLVVFAGGSNSSCTSITPSIYIDKTGYSRFDHANKAYEFGIIPPDSLYHNGKVGDVNPLDPGRAPSNDFIYCTTGAQPTDPTEPACGSEYNANIYSGGINNYLYPAPNASGGYAIPRRNLWYTFVLNEGGNVKVKVSNKTSDKNYPFKFAVYKSDVNGSLPFTGVVNSGQVDSTVIQGLSFVVNNWSYYYCYNAPDEVSFYRDPCSGTPERYYVLVENSNTWPQYPSGMYPNSQAEVSILLDSVNSIQPLFDHYSQASNIGSALGAGTYISQTDNFSCATRDASDPIASSPADCHKTLWYKFSSSVTGHVRYRAIINNQGYPDAANIILFRQILPNDSTGNGLESYTGIPAYDNQTGYWYQNCISPGTYYLILPGCSKQNEYAHVELQIIEEVGDFCSNPVLAPLNGAGTSTSSVIVDCHTIGTDYGEFNPMLTCPNGGITTDYKTSWFKIDISGTDTLDITTYLTENTNANPANIKYRLMNGDCSAMQERSCVQDALTQDTYKCLAPGSYWVQVFTPYRSVSYPYLEITGTIDLHLSAVHHADTCAPIVSCFSNSNFIPQFNCNLSDFVTFVNYSTFGSSIVYTWNFGYNSQTSSAVSPQFSYPALPTSQTYNVSLTVQNTSCGGQSTASGTITIPPRPAVDLGPDIFLCNGGTAALDATSYPGATYQWQDGSVNPTFVASQPGLHSYYVAVTFNGCTRSDTINVNINPIIPQVQNKYICNNDPITLNASRGLGESHHWNTGVTASSINITLAGIYWDDMTLNGCITRDSFIVSNTVYPLGNDIEACFLAQAVMLNAATTGAVGYTWQNGSTGSTFNATSPGLYWVDISFTNCSLRDSVVLTNLQPLLLSTGASICQGQTYTLLSGTIVSIAGTYRDTTRSIGGCDSLINTINLAVQSVTTTNANAAICPGQTYSLPWGVVVSTSGVYRDTLHYATGCDSIRRIVNLTVQSATLQTINPTVCSGQTYILPWGPVVSSSGIYRDTLHYTTACDSIWRTVNLTVQSATLQTTNPIICAGQTYNLPGGSVVNTSGIYRDTLHYTTGCDSIWRAVNLTVQPATSQTLNPIICAGQTYTLPWGPVVGTAGIYRDTLHYITGCDSIRRTVNLNVQSATSQTINPIICTGQTYTLPWGPVVSATGIYRDTLHFITGCDSIWRTVNLTAQSATFQTTNAAICSGQTYTLPWGLVVSTSGIYRDTLHYSTGCDSIRRIVNLTVQSPTLQTTNAAICSGQTYTLPWGPVVNTSGVYTDTLHYITECDSIWRTVDLTVQSATLQTTNPIICAGQTYTLPWGLVVSTTGIYRDTLHSTTGCDSIWRTVNLTVQSATSQTTNSIICAGQTYALPWGLVVSTAGMYRDTLHYTTGCDSIWRTVNLTVQSATLQITNVAICSGQSYTLPWGPVVSSSGIYRDTLHYTTGCDSLWRTVNLTVHSATLQTTNPIICAGQTYNLPWGSVVSTTGIYRDTLHYLTGCDSIWITVNLTVQSATSQNINRVICAGQTFTLPWGPVVSATGIYRDTLHYTSGCDSIRRTVNLIVQSAISATTNAIICQGASYSLPWGPIVNIAGIYHDTLYYTTGCDSVRRTVNLQVKAPAVSATSVTICSDETYTLPWGLMTNTAGIYRDTVRTTLGCDSLIRTVSLKVDPAPSVFISKSNDINCTLSITNLRASGGVNYTWTPAATLNNANIYNPVASPMATTWYKVLVTSDKGCTAEDSIQVKVIAGNLADGYLVPNAFTPNGDGKNDCFGVQSWGAVTDFELSVYNRWDERVFYTRDPRQCWDGRYKGKEQSANVFVYQIRAKGLCGEIYRKGTVVLIR